MTYLQLLTIIEEMIENGMINQFDEIDKEKIEKMLDKTGNA